jgi:hypothetical protein
MLLIAMVQSIIQMASIFLQAMGVALNLVLTCFVCLQTMQYFLKTGFGTARKGFGGLLLLPLMGLIQGSGAALATRTVVSTVIVTSYKRKGYGAFFLGLVWLAVYHCSTTVC